MPHLPHIFIVQFYEAILQMFALLKLTYKEVLDHKKFRDHILCTYECLPVFVCSPSVTSMSNLLAEIDQKFC